MTGPEAPAFELTEPVPYEFPTRGRLRQRQPAPWSDSDNPVSEESVGSGSGSRSPSQGTPTRRQVTVEAVQALTDRWATQAGAVSWPKGVEATVVAVALQGGDRIAAHSAAEDLLNWINTLHIHVDDLAQENELVKLNNNGFEFQLVTGHFPGGQAEDATHPQRAMMFAKHLLPYISSVVSPLMSTLQVRISIHTGIIHSAKFEGTDWFMFRLLGTDARIAPMMLHHARTGYITASAPFVQKLGHRGPWRESEVLCLGWRKRGLQLLEMGPADLLLYDVNGRLANMPWRRQRRVASNWWQATYFPVCRLLRTYISIVKQMRRTLLRKLSARPSGDWSYAHSALTPRSDVAGVLMLQGRPSFEACPAPVAQVPRALQEPEGRCYPPRPRSVRGVHSPVYPHGSGTTVAGIPLMPMFSYAVDACGSVCAFVLQPLQAPWQRWVEPYISMRFADRGLENKFMAWEACAGHPTGQLSLQLVKRAVWGWDVMALLSLAVTAVHCAMVLIMGICMSSAAKCDVWHIALVLWRLLPLAFTIVPHDIRKKNKITGLVLLRVGFMLSFTYQFVFSTHSPIGDHSMRSLKRLLLAYKVIFYAVHGLDVQIIMQLPFDLYMPMEVALFGAIVGVDMIHCSRASEAGLKLGLPDVPGECMPGYFQLWVLCQWVAVVAVPVAFVWFRERYTRSVFFRQQEQQRQLICRGKQESHAISEGSGSS